MPDAANISEPGGEIRNYLKRAGGGSEFRENPEMVDKWYRADGSLNEEAIANADVYTLITPSRERALKLNKAYTHIVRHQSYIHGRDASGIPLLPMGFAHGLATAQKPGEARPPPLTTRPSVEYERVRSALSFNVIFIDIKLHSLSPRLFPPLSSFDNWWENHDYQYTQNTAGYRHCCHFLAGGLRWRQRQ